MILLPSCLCCRPKRYKCVDEVCVEDPSGGYTEPTCGGNCDPPCGCPDWCLYKIEFLSPLAYGPRPFIPCVSDNSDFFEVSVHPPCEGGEPAPDVPRSYLNLWIYNGYASVSYGTSFGALVWIELDLGCREDPYGKYTSIYAEIRYLMKVDERDYDGNPDTVYAIRKSAVIELDADCQNGVGITCSKPFDEISRLPILSMPLEFTVDSSSAGLGEWGTVEYEYGPPEESEFAECYKHLIENFAATFRITKRNSCEGPPDPCTILIDGERVPVWPFYPWEVITATWRGLSAPGNDKLFVDGELVSDIQSGGVDVLTNITRAGCSIGQIVDSKGVYIASSGTGVMNACDTQESRAKYVPLSCELVNETTARLYGGVKTMRFLSPCSIDGEPTSDSISEENQWLWECLIVDGVLGEVTVSPVAGARYFNNEPVACAVTHEAPVVTLNFIP